MWQHNDAFFTKRIRMTEYSWISIRPNDQSQGKWDKDNKKTYFSATFWPPSVICAFSCPLHLLNQNQNLHAFSFASSFSRLLISFDHLLMISLSHSYVCDDDLSFLFLSSFVASCPAACFLHHYLLHLEPEQENKGAPTDAIRDPLCHIFSSSTHFSPFSITIELPPKPKNGLPVRHISILTWRSFCYLNAGDPCCFAVEMQKWSKHKQVLQ